MKHVISSTRPSRFVITPWHNLRWLGVTLKRTKLLRFLTRLLLCGVILGIPGGATMALGATELLKLRFSTKLPDGATPTGYRFHDAPAQLQWSPDNRYLAIFGFSSRKLYLLDVDRNEIIDRNILFRGAGQPNIAWSADSSLLALSDVDIGLFRVADGMEIGRRNRFRYARCSTLYRGAGFFTADGRSLWLSCGARGERGSYSAAEKLSIPDLGTVDSVDVEGLDAENQNFTQSDRIVAENGKILLLSLLESCSQPVVKEPLQCQPYAAAIDLETKQRIFPSFLLQRSHSAGYAYDLQFLPDNSQIISFRAWAQGGSPGPAFISYDLSGKPIRQFGIRDEFKDVTPREFVATRSGLVIGTAGSFGSEAGRLMIWDVHTGELLQNTSTSFASFIALSPDGRHVAAQVGPEIRIYLISKN